MFPFEFIYVCLKKIQFTSKPPGLCDISANLVYGKTTCACKPKVNQSNFTQDTD